MGIFSGIPILGGVIDKVGDKIIKGREVWKGNAENELQRGADGYASARSYVPQGWLAKQIRPWVTIVTLIPQLLLAINLGWQIYLHMETGDNLSGINAAVALFSGMGAIYYAYTGTIMTFWFGGQDGKYRRAHKETMAGVHTPAVARETSSNAPAGTRDGFVDVIGDDIKKLSKLETFQRRRRNRD